MIPSPTIARIIAIIATVALYIACHCPAWRVFAVIALKFAIIGRPIAPIIGIVGLYIARLCLLSAPLAPHNSDLRKSSLLLLPPFAPHCPHHRAPHRFAIAIIGLIASNQFFKFFFPLTIARIGAKSQNRIFCPPLPLIARIIAYVDPHHNHIKSVCMVC